MRPLLPCLTLGLLYVLPAIPSHAGLIINGDFELAVPQNGTGNGWTSSGVDFGGWSGSNGNPGGHMLLNLNGVANRDPTVQQTVSGLTIGQQYTLSFDYALHVSISPNGSTFGVFLDTQVDPSALDNSKAIFLGENLSFTYVTETVNFVATSTTHELFFSAELDNRTNGGIGNSDVSYRLDNVTLNASTVPEPSSAFALGLPIAMLIARRRRK